MSEHDDDYRVGYRRPPKASRFQKGRSGNPAGRPKKKTSSNDLLREELGRSIRLNSGEVISVRQAIIRAALKDLAQGKVKQWAAALTMVEKYDPQPEFQPTKRDEELLKKLLQEMNNEVADSWEAPQERT